MRPLLLTRPAPSLPRLIRLKSTTAASGGTFRPLHHPLRGGKGGVQSHTGGAEEGSRSVAALANRLGNYGQRALVTGLAGLTVWGIYAIWDVHTQIMARAQAEYDKRHPPAGGATTTSPDAPSQDVTNATTPSS